MTYVNPISALPKDSGWSWMSLVGGLLMNTITAGGIFKSFGIIFSHVQAKYDISAAFLSWIPSCTVGLALIMGPLSNSLASRFSTRRVVITGSVFAMAGYVLSSFAGSAWLFFFTYGMLIGVGVGLLYGPSIVVVNQYFEKKRGLANGVSLAGSGIGSVAIPPIMVYTLHSYGVEGTLLIMGGIALNVCISGMLFRPATFYMRRHLLKIARCNRMCTVALHAGTKQPSDDMTGEVIADASTGGHVNPICSEDIYFDETVINTQRSRQSAKSSQSKGRESGENDNVKTPREEGKPWRMAVDRISAGQHQPENDTKVHDKDDSTTGQKNSNAISENNSTKSDSPKVRVNVIDVESHSNDAIPNAGTSCCCESKSQPKPSVFEFRLLTNPILLIYCTSFAAAGSIYFNMFIMATPHAEQLGFTYTNAAMLVSIMGGADTISRVVFGTLADLKIVKTQHMFHASLALSTVVLFTLPSLKTYVAIAIACVLFAVAGGGYISLLSTLLAEVMGVEHLPTTFGVVVFTVGWADIIMPVITGKLRDVTGTWDTSFYTCGGIMVAVTLLNLLMPLATKTGQRMLNKI